VGKLHGRARPAEWHRFCGNDPTRGEATDRSRKAQDGNAPTGFSKIAKICRWPGKPAAACRSVAVMHRNPRSFRGLARALLFGCRNPPAQRSGKTMMGDSLFGIHGMALELRARRLGVLTSNIANAATPGYKARDIDFTGALKAMTQGASTPAAVSAATQYRVPVMPSLDGNTVEMSTEQTAFGENAIQYEATLNMLQDRVQTVTRALKGE
jgi:flagellar basal-body rod protein FlgB